MPTRTLALLARPLLLAALALGLAAGPAAAQPAPDPARPGEGRPPESARPGGAVDTADDGLYSCEKARGRFKINLPADIELKDLVTWAFSFTCKNFIYSSEIATRVAKVTIKSPEAMSAQQAWRVFLVALRSMKLSVVPRGNILEIVEDAQAKDKPLPIYDKGVPGSSDDLVRVVLRPENLSVDDLAGVLTELKSVNGNVKSVPRAGIVLVTDYASNVSRMSQLMLAVDQSVAGERLYMVRVKYADATDIVDTLNEILGLKGAASDAPVPGAAVPTGRAARRRARDAAARGEVPTDPTAAAAALAGAGEDFSDVEAAVPSKLIADDRTNSIIMLGSEPSYLRVKALVSRLDVDLDVEGGGRIHVYFLENADAEQLGTTLQTVISGITQNQTGGSGTTNTGNRNRNVQSAAPGGEAGGAAFEGQVRISHDKATNSIVIVSSVKDFLAVREIIRKLDSPRPQVYIEATIAEVSVTNSRTLGTTFHGGKPFGDGSLLIGGAQHTGFSSIALASALSATGAIGGAIGAPLEGAAEILGTGTSIPSFAVLFNALATAGLGNVLSTPHLLTKDNEEAEISVGEQVPTQSAIVGGAAGAAAGALFPTQSIQRIDVALTMKVTPHIGASEMVSLDIDLEISDIFDKNFNSLGPATSKRTIKDKVVVRDQQSIVLGGLISDKVTSNESKVPLLGDIPVLGYLFKFTTKSKEKRNLLVILTPYIIKDQADLERLKERRTREHQEFVRTHASFADIRYAPSLDYRRKRGLIDQIDRAVRRSEEEADLMRELEDQMIGLPDGPIDYRNPEPAAAPPAGDGVAPAAGATGTGATSDTPAASAPPARGGGSGGREGTPLAGPRAPWTGWGLAGAG